MDHSKKVAMSPSNTEIIFLGTGTSIGVPVIGCDCAVCTSDDPKNKRLRSSILVRSPEGTIVVDTGPDFRQQCLRENITHIDGVIYTHPHTDHIMGFDDLRRFTVGTDASLDIYARPSCMSRLKASFDYAFNGQNKYYGYLKPVSHPIDGPFSLCGWTITPLEVKHGKVETIGFHFSSESGERFAYIPDAKTISDKALDIIKDTPLLILDGLQMGPHNTHLSIPESIKIAHEVGAKCTWLTHFSCRVDYRELEPDLPHDINLAWDGLTLSLPTV
ncbi:MAG: MBL fold metallo-hydrolase [Verrucomicrobiales bacterium]|nr:MBL fold metallo-hydrolase [Verrucomicrobiales bacterium]